MRLLFIRHAQSANNELWAATGDDLGRSPDPDLTALGHRQAAALAQVIATDAYPGITHLYTSLFLRAVQTAAPLADALELPLVGTLDTFEVYGPYEGSHGQRIVWPGSAASLLRSQSTRLALPDRATEEGWWLGPVETPELATTRAATVAAWLRREHDDDATVALVSHGDFGRYLLRELLTTRALFALWNTSTTLVEVPVDPAAPARVEWINRVDHLAADERTDVITD